MATQKIIPLFDNILVKPVDMEQKLPAGIVLPESASKEESQMGEVVAVGPGGTDEKGNAVNMIVKVGQRVFYKKWGNHEVKMNNMKYVIVEQKDVLAIFE
jgi:chaperonin GroES